MWIQWLLLLCTTLQPTCTPPLPLSLIFISKFNDCILSNLIPKFSNHMICIGRHRKRMTARHFFVCPVRTTERISSCHKGKGLFQNIPPSPCPSPFDSDTRLECQNPPFRHSCRNSTPNWKIPPKNSVEAEAYLSFYSTKRFTHLQLNSPTKAPLSFQHHC